MLPDGNEVEMHSFPTVQQMSKLTEQRLREMGFGYRAKYIVGTVVSLPEARGSSLAMGRDAQAERLKAAASSAHQQMLSEQGGTEHLTRLRSMPRPEVKSQLLEYPGVGPKVADCVALFCLDQTDCIPGTSPFPKQEQEREQEQERVQEQE
eukprot:scaffold614_cov255-Pinguiococcus_pyrenoidosus.AAC.2